MLIWLEKERVLSKMTPRLLVASVMDSEQILVFEREELAPMTSSSDLLLLNFR